MPSAAIVAPSGLVYISNSGGHEILEYDPGSGDTRRVAGTGAIGFNGDGAAEEAMLAFPIDIDVTGTGLLIIADGHNNRIRAVNLNETGDLEITGRTIPAGEMVTLAGGGATSTVDYFFQNETTDYWGDGQHGLASAMDWPYAPRVVNGAIFFVDADNHRIRMIDEFGYVHLISGVTELPDNNGLRLPFGSVGVDIGDGGAGIDADLNRPMDINFRRNESDGWDIAIGDTDFYRVRLLEGVNWSQVPY